MTLGWAVVAFVVTAIEEAIAAHRSIAWIEATKAPPGRPLREFLRDPRNWRAAGWSAGFEAILYLGMFILVVEVSAWLLIPFCLGAATGSLWTLYRRK